MIPEAATASQVPGMEAWIPGTVDCLSFRSCRGDDTLDAFAPIAQYA